MGVFERLRLSFDIAPSAQHAETVNEHERAPDDNDDPGGEELKQLNAEQLDAEEATGDFLTGHCRWRHGH